MPATSPGGVGSTPDPAGLPARDHHTVSPYRPANWAGHSVTPPTGEDYCLGDRLEAFDRPAWGAAPPPWAPGRRETIARVRRMARDNPVYDDRLVLLSEVDIFADLSPEEVAEIGKAAPMRVYPAGALLYSPHHRVEALFILKGGRIRIFRLSVDGRALSTAIIAPGTIFGEMVLLGQQMYDNYAEALDEALVCVMGRADVHRFLLSDPRISTRIAEILGMRLKAMEQQYIDAVFKSVPQRIAATLCTLGERAPAPRRPGLIGGGPTPLALTHEQIAALVGTSRETATKALGDFAEQGLVKLGRGKIFIIDRARLADEAGERW